MSDTKLLPCPFCGATEHDDDMSLVDGMSHDGSVIFVACLGCGASGPPVEYVVDASSVVTSWPKAVAAWNRRPLRDAVVEAARECVTDSYRPTPEYDRLRWDRLHEAVEALDREEET
jgi:hypothetical protein